MNESFSYSKGYIDFRTSPSDSKNSCRNEDILEKPLFKDNFFSRFLSFFCLYKPKASMHPKNIDNEKSRFVSNFLLEDTLDRLKVARSMNAKKDISNESNQMENSDVTPSQGKETSALGNNKNAKELENEFPHSQCFFLCYKEKYIVLSRILNKKFYVDKKGSLTRTPEVFSDYLAQRFKKYSMILQFGGLSAMLTKKFAKFAEFIVGVDPSSTLSSQKPRISLPNVEILRGNNLQCLRNNFQNFDLIFLIPEWKNMKNESDVIGFRDLEPNLIDLLKQALTFTQNIVVSLPNYVNLNELALIIKELRDQKLL